MTRPPVSPARRPAIIVMLLLLASLGWASPSLCAGPVARSSPRRATLPMPAPIDRARAGSVARQAYRSPSPSPRPTPGTLRLRAELDTIWAGNALRGTAASDPHHFGLFTYDFSMHEYGLAGGPAVLGHKGTRRVVQPTSYSRVLPGSSLGTNLRVFLEAPLGRRIFASLAGEFYARQGSAKVAHHWGPHVPNFFSASESFVANFLNLLVHSPGPKGRSSWELQAGDFYPEYSSARHSGISTANFVLRGSPQPTWWRNAGHLEFEGYPDDFSWPGRDRFRGVDVGFSGPTLHGEIFKAADDRPAFLKPPEDVAGVRTYSRDLVGAHLGARTGRLETGLFWMNVYGSRIGLPWERQAQWAFNASWRLGDEASLYGIISDSRYHRPDHASSYSGTAWLAGVGGKVPVLASKHPLEYALELKSASPNYDPMRIHKTEHYPSNYSGWWLRLAQPFPNGRVLLSYLEHRQLDPGMTVGKWRNPAPDPFFDIPGNTRPGLVSTATVEGRYRLPRWPLAVTLGYEAAWHRLSSPVADVGKNVRRLYAGLRVPLDRDRLWIDATLNDFRVAGQWSQVPGSLRVDYHLRQSVPRFGLAWQFRPGDRLWIQYSPQTTVDRSVIEGVPSRADWENGQWLVELRARL